MVACTIVARNYVAQARVLARSFLAHNPDAKFVALILDYQDDGLDPGDGRFDVVTPYQIGIDRHEFHNMAAIYSVMELATAVKPALLKTLLVEHEAAIYLDPDIQVFEPLPDIPKLAIEHGIVLTPHVLQPLARDGLEPSETTILRAGMFNLGFIAVSRKAGSFLDWWHERLARECIVAPEQGRFVDQRWVDFVPALYDHVILRDPGLNVAWWNLSDRLVTGNGQWQVDGEPIRFFHFSGYDPKVPRRLTKHAGSIPRLQLKERRDLIPLCDQYAGLLEAEGYQFWSGMPYGLAATASGVEIDPSFRARYRAALADAEERGAAPPPDAFEETAAADLSRWLGGGNGARSQAYGVNVVGYLTTESGVGEAARQLVRGIAEVGIPYSTATYTNAESRQSHHFVDVAAGLNGRYEVNVICINADQLPIFVQNADPDLLPGRYSIGVWFWEAPIFPRSMHAAFHLVDEVWVASDYIAAAIARETDKPVRIFPLPVVVSDVQNTMHKSDVGFPNSFVFFFVFDFLSIFERKNPLAVVEAFSRAFDPSEGPVLVVKSINGTREPERLERLRAAASGRADIRIVDGYVSAEQKNAMMALCDCYVSLHRSEGFGLTMAEAMAHGRPVIATGHGGNVQFMTADNSFLVPFELVPISPDARPYPTAGEWAEPDVSKASELMRRVFEDPQTAAEVAARGRSDIRSRHAPREAGRFVASRLGEIAVRGARGAAPAPGTSTALTLAEVVAARGPGGDFLGRPSRGAPAELVRRGLRRGLWPFLVHQDEVNRSTVAAVGEVAAGLRREEAKLAALERRPPDVSRGEFDAVRAKLHNASVALEALSERFEALSTRFDALSTRFEAVTAALYPTPYMVDPGMFRVGDPETGEALGYEDGPDGPQAGIYLGFESIFRGTEQFIRDRQRYYVDLVRERAPVLEIGSGRGEFLELMREHAIAARGVDMLGEMVEHAQAKGLDVEWADGIEYLAAQANASIGAIFSAQVIEHLPFEQLLRLLELARVKLKPGGILIAETVNLHSLAAARTFSVDPTHVTPVFPEVALALARLHGYVRAKIVYPNGKGELEPDRREQGEYALIAEIGSQL